MTDTLIRDRINIAYRSTLNDSNIKIPKKNKSTVIKGKKIAPNTQVTINNRDKTPPGKIYAKRVQEKTSPSKKPCQTKRKKLEKNTKKKSKPNVIQKTEIKEPGCPASQNSVLKPRLKSIIKESLKKEKIKRLGKEKEKQVQNEKKEQRKLDLNKQNILIRLENSKWKQVKLNHKHDWGIDQRARDFSSERPTSRKAKSTERVRGNLDYKDWLEAKSLVHNRTLSHGSEKGLNLKPKFYRDKKIIEYIKNKQNDFKQQQELENLQKIAKDSRKINDLNKLEFFRKAMRKKRGKKKGKKEKKEKKNTEENLYKIDLVYEAIQQYENKDNARQLANTETVQKKPRSLDLKNKAAVKIQSLVRRFLVRCRVAREDCWSADELIQQILDREKSEGKGLTRSDGKKNLEVFTISDSPESELSVSVKEKKELKEKVVTMQAQLQTLGYLKEREIEDMKKIAARTGIDLEVENLIREIISNRYLQLSSVLEGSIQEIKQEFLDQLNTEEKESFYSDIEIKLEKFYKIIQDQPVCLDRLMEKLEKQPGENLAVLKVNLSSEDSFQPVDTPQFSAIFSPLNKSSEFPGSVAESKDLSLSPDFQLSSIYQLPNPKEDSYKNISILQDLSMELSSSIQGELSETYSNTSDYIPERPSAPTNFIDGSSPSLNEEASTLSPCQLIDLSEEILMSLISEHEVFRINWESLKVKTDTQSILEYCESIYKYCDLDDLQEVIKRPNEISRVSALQDIRENLLSSVNPVTEVLNISIYFTLEFHLDQVKKSEKPCYVNEEVYKWVVESEHIHNKLLFDANNEVLSKLRPSSLTNLPLPSKPRPLTPSQDFYQIALSTLSLWSQCELGKISFESQPDEEACQHIREENLTRTLKAEVKESSQDWLDYEFEEIQVKLELSDDIIEYLSGELVFILN